jgi:hypothetical protein
MSRTLKLNDIQECSVALAAWFDSQEINAAQSLVIVSCYARAMIAGIVEDPERGVEAFCEDMKIKLRQELK